MKKQISSDFNTRQYMQPVDFELFYYNDATLKSVAPMSMITMSSTSFWKVTWNITWGIKAISWNTATVS